MKCKNKILLTDKTTLECQKVLRYLPNNRLVVLAKWKEQLVVAKLFSGIRKYYRLRKAISGARHLQDAHILTPKILHRGVSKRGELVVIFEFLENGVMPTYSLLQDDNVRLGSLFVQTLARLHEARLRQKDLHFGNFMLVSHQLFVLDADIIVRYKKEIPEENCIADLVSLLLPYEAEKTLAYVEEYFKCRHWIFEEKHKKIFEHQLLAVHQKNLGRRCKRTLRNTTKNLCLKSKSQFFVCQRDRYNHSMQLFLRDLESNLRHAELLFQDSVYTLYQVKIDDQIYQIMCFRQAWLAKKKWFEVVSKNEKALMPVAFLIKRTAWVLNQGAYLMLACETE